jgi:UDP-galactose-lipid carrier transferase
MDIHAEQLNSTLIDKPKKPSRFAIPILLLGDFLGFLIALPIAYSLLSFFSVPAWQDNWLLTSYREMQSGLYLYTVVSVFGTLWFSTQLGHYTYGKPFWIEVRELLRTIGFLAVINLAAASLLEMHLPWTWWVTTWLTAAIAVPAIRMLFKVGLLRQGVWTKPTLIMGTGKRAWETYQALSAETMMGCKIAGFVAVSPQIHPLVFGVGAVIHDRFPVEDMKRLSTTKVVFALEEDQQHLRDRWIRTLLQNGFRDVAVISEMRGIPVVGANLHVLSQELLLMRVQNNLARTYARLLKRTLDFAAALGIIALAMPVYIAISLWILYTGASPLFAHERIGKGGKPFKCYKFRTMVPDADDRLKTLLACSAEARQEWANGQKLKNDPRITSAGQFLRRTSLDELPQVWNVLKGDMSLVGPRPIVNAELERYEENVGYYTMTKPGITGLWQVSGRNDLDYSTRVFLDVWYLKNWSFWYDIAILGKTVMVVLKRSGAC